MTTAKGDFLFLLVGFVVGAVGATVTVGGSRDAQVKAMADSVSADKRTIAALNKDTLALHRTLAQRAAAWDSVVARVPRVLTKTVQRTVHDTTTVTYATHDTIATPVYIGSQDIVNACDGYIEALKSEWSNCQAKGVVWQKMYEAEKTRGDALATKARRPFLQPAADVAYSVIGGLGTPEADVTLSIGGRVTGIAGLELYGGKVLPVLGGSVRIWP